MLPVGNKSSYSVILQKEFGEISKAKKNTSKKGDSLEISPSMNAFKKLDDFLNLGKSDRLDTSDLSPEEKKEFLKMLSKLLKLGIVGYEELEVDGKKEKHYIVNQIGDQRLKDAKLWDEYRYTPRGKKLHR